MWKGGDRVTEREKREKVIKGLECHMAILACNKCPYYCGDTCSGIDDVVYDALALLKAQEARVMTLDEVRRHDGAVFLARDDGTGDWAICCDEASDTLTFVHGSRRGHIASYKKDAYGPRWRCWTSRPTDAQREATAWEKGQK